MIIKHKPKTKITIHFKLQYVTVANSRQHKKYSHLGIIIIKFNFQVLNYRKSANILNTKLIVNTNNLIFLFSIK